MARYLVSYDLDQPPQKPDYHPLIKRIEEWGGRRVLYSEWLVKANTTAKELRDDLARYIDSNDGLIVLGLSGEAAWQGTGIQLTTDTVKELLAA